MKMKGAPHSGHGYGRRRSSYKQWRVAQDHGFRTMAVLPAWNAGDQVEIIGTGLSGRIVRMTTLDYTLWEVALPHGRFIETHANNLRKVTSTCPVHPDAIGRVAGCLGCR